MPTRFMVKEENGLLKKSTINNSICKFPDASSSSSSSIGKNSDLSENSMEKSGDGEEVQSPYDKGALDAMEALEEVLPMRRGISSFYNGKSKSYTSLACASSASSSAAKDIGKPDDPYTRKRRNQLSRTLRWEDQNRGTSGHLKKTGGFVLYKKPKTSTSYYDKKDGECIDSGRSSSASLSSSGSTDILPWRSFSVADLRRCVFDR